MAKRLTDQAKTAVLTTPKLYGEVAEILEILPTSLPMTLKRNANTTTSFSVVSKIADHLGVEPETLIEEVPDAIVQTSSLTG